MKKYIKALFISFITFGWGFPLISAAILIRDKFECLEKTCSFPYDYMIGNLLSLTGFWLFVSILTYAMQIKRS